VIKLLSLITDLSTFLLLVTLFFYSSTSSAGNKLSNLEALSSQSVDLDFEHKDAFENWSAIGDQEEQITFTQGGLRSADFDMDFEHEDPLVNWIITGDHENKIIDTQIFIEGKQSLHLSTENSLKKFPQSILSQTLYTSFERNFISLSGFIRYKNINVEGRFNIFLTTYDENNEKSISKYIEHKFRSTTDWYKFEITLPISQEISYVNIGAVLNGRGKAWLDDLTISFPKNHKNNYQ
jgi:hypothetical protein